MVRPPEVEEVMEDDPSTGRYLPLVLPANDAETSTRVMVVEFVEPEFFFFSKKNINKGMILSVLY